MDILDGRRNTINQEQPPTRSRKELSEIRAETIRHERTSDVEKNYPDEFVPPVLPCIPVLPAAARCR